MTDLILLQSFPDKMTADVAQETLATHGIAAIPQPQDMPAATVPGFSSQTNVSVNIFVHRDDYEKARNILGI